MKISKYNTILEVSEHASIVYNAFTGKFLVSNHKLSRLISSGLIELIKKDYPTFYSNLCKIGAVVDDDIDETTRTIREFQNTDNDPSIYHLTILPTLNCIFKCWYCYEDHQVGTNMTPETIKRIEHLLSNINADTAVKSLQVSFFGGEPFMQKSVITHILQYIHSMPRREDLSVFYTATTNGYLLNDSIIHELKRYTPQFNFQITLDGDRKTHDIIRYINGNTGSYDKIIQNIKSLVRNQFYVKIRLNYTSENIGSMYGITDDLSGLSPADKKNIDIALFRVWQDIPRGNIDDDVNHLLEHFLNEGFNTSVIPATNLKVSCYADKRNGAIVSYDGKVFRCTARDFMHFPEDGYLDNNGHIVWKNGINEKRLLAKYNNVHCYDCRIYPICKGGCSQKALESAGQRYCTYNFDEQVKDNIVLQLFKQTLNG